MGDRTYSNLYGLPEHFDGHDTDYPTLAAAFGGGTATARDALLTNSTTLVESTPTVLALVLPGDTNHVVFVHRPTVHRGTPLTNRIIAVMGNSNSGNLPFLLQAEAFH